MNQKELLLLSFTIFLTIVAWMLVDIYRVRTNLNIEAGSQFTKGVEFKLNSDLIERLKNRAP